MHARVLKALSITALKSFQNVERLEKCVGGPREEGILQEGMQILCRRMFLQVLLKDKSHSFREYNRG